MKHIEKIYDATTNEETLVERNYTKEELAHIAAVQENAQKILQEAEAKAIARQAILDRLGLNEEEARLLLG